MIVLLAIGLVAFAVGLVYVSLILYNQVSYVYGSSAGRSIDPDVMNGTALLVIGAQNAFMHTDNPDDSTVRARESIVNINRVIRTFRKAGKEVIFVNHVKRKNSSRAHLMPHIPVIGTYEAQVNDDIPLLGSVAIRQFRSDAFSNSKLQRYFDRRGIGRLYVVGYSAEESIYYTVESALNRKYEVFVVQDAVVSAFGNKSKQLESYEQMGAKLIDSRQFEAEAK